MKTAYLKLNEEIARHKSDWASCLYVCQSRGFIGLSVTSLNLKHSEIM